MREFTNLNTHTTKLEMKINMPAGGGVVTVTIANDGHCIIDNQRRLIAKLTISCPQKLTIPGIMAMQHNSLTVADCNIVDILVTGRNDWQTTLYDAIELAESLLRKSYILQSNN